MFQGQDQVLARDEKWHRWKKKTNANKEPGDFNCQQRRSKTIKILPTRQKKMTATREGLSNRERSELTIFENQRKSLIHYCERSGPRLQFEWTKIHKKCQKWSILASF